MRSSIEHSLRGAVLLCAAALSACGLMQDRRTLPDPPPQAVPDGAPAVPDKGDPQARFDAAMQLWRQNQIAEAEAAFTALVKDFPEHGGPWTNLGILYARSNRRAQAIGALAKAATINPQNIVAFNWLGILYREAGDLARAQLAYERALQIDPDYALAHYNLGVLLDAHLRRPDAALPHYRAYLEHGNAEDLRVLAWIAEIEAAQRARAAQPPAAAQPQEARP